MLTEPALSTTLTKQAIAFIALHRLINHINAHKARKVIIQVLTRLKVINTHPEIVCVRLHGLHCRQDLID